MPYLTDDSYELPRAVNNRYKLYNRCVFINDFQYGT